ncbi:MAG: very short patch repair endonuclease [Victivallaceae bacterium]|nr:very short patch repair endonuclease [Victivallaceae bacterium]
MDCYDMATRSRTMSRVHSKNTKPELYVRRELHKAGFRFRLHNSHLPCKPDIILPKYKTVIFVHGCFWHRHPNCKRATTPATNTEYWQKKFKRNVERDKLGIEQLKNAGWTVCVIWECELVESTKFLIKDLSLNET